MRSRTRGAMVVGILTVVSCRPAGNVPAPPPYVPTAPLPPVGLALPSPPIEPQSITPAPPSPAGPTRMSRIPGGYELRNDRVRVVISAATGDMTFWGSPGGRNLLLQPGVVICLVGLPSAAPTGYVEPRDPETWQFFGSDANHITWRKIYCLDDDSLLASFTYQDDRPAPLTTAVQLTGDLAAVRIRRRTIDHFSGSSAFGFVSLRACNENKNPATRPSFPVLLQSDTHVCPPGDRESFTTQWRLTEADEEQK